MPLTNTSVKNFQPGDKVYRKFDERCLYIEVSPDGSKRWRMKYRFGGLEKRLAFGVFPEVSLKEARERRDAARLMLRDGVDPGQHKKITKQAARRAATNAFQTVSEEWLARQSTVWSDGHTITVINRLKNHVWPYIGDVAIDSLKPPALLEVLRRVEASERIETAHRILVIMGQVFRYGVATAKIESDPSRDLKGALTPIKPKHLPAITSPADVGQLLRMLDAYNGTEVVRCALKLAPLFFVRPGELRHARWQEIDFDNALWRFRVSKTNIDHMVPLARQSLKILTDLKMLTGHQEWVFPGPRHNGRPMSNNAILAALRSLGIPQENMCGHGFRAMARTLLDEELKFPPHLIEHQLAHAVKDPNGRAYNRTTFLKERRNMMQQWADYLEELRKDAPNRTQSP